MIAALVRLTPDRRSPRVEPRGVAVRIGAGGTARPHAAPARLAGGAERLADTGLELEVERTDHGHAATLALALVHRGDEPVFVDSVTLGLRWCGHGARSHRFLRHGWQSWSFTGARDLDAAGEQAFPSGPWLRGMYHCVGERPAERAGWHESETLAVVGPPAGGPVCLAGVLETGRCFGVVHLRRAAGDPTGAEQPVDVDVELRVEVALQPGERLSLEAVRIAIGDDPAVLLERFATLWGRVAGARVDAAFQAGWCSWYHYFHDIDEAALLRNLDALAADRDGLPIDVVQLDDGYQRTIGDWLQTNARFPGGLGRVAEAIRSAGFVPGIWTAPFAASAESTVLGAHPDWALRDAGGERWLRGPHNAAWSADGWVYALDPSHPGVRAHVEDTFRALRGLGFSYQKLDFLYMAAMEGRAADPSTTRAARLRAGLEAVRRGAGDDAFLLGCGCPLGPAVGVVDGMRIGPDVAPSWGVDAAAVIPGLEAVLPSTASALRSIEARLFMHRRLWLNDPDCLMARSRDTKLRPEEARSLAAAIGVSGGITVMSDDVALLAAHERALVARTVESARAVDRAGSSGGARAIDLLSPGPLRRLAARTGPDAWRAAINVGEGAVETDGDEALAAAVPGRPVAELSGPDADRLAPHASDVRVHPGAVPLAVFCDFDGTFSVRDVGSTIAQEQLPERRKALWSRYESGAVDAWEYAEQLFDGLAFGPEALDAFLRTVELDPGAKRLVGWCRGRGIPLRILSDGFDHNLDRLQVIHDVSFDYSANHLRFDGDRWRISPVRRNPACDCGTGACKRAVLEAHRRARPNDCLVHIGNGRVSDRCGAEAADLVFAKESLAEELAQRGVAYVPFATLHDVVDALEADRAGAERPAPVRAAAGGTRGAGRDTGGVAVERGR